MSGILMGVPALCIHGYSDDISSPGTTFRSVIEDLRYQLLTRFTLHDILLKLRLKNVSRSLIKSN